MIYRPGIYNLQSRALTFSELEKLLQKVNLRYLKTQTTNKLNTKNLQIKYFPCSKYMVIYRPDLYNLQTTIKLLKK